MTNFLTLYIQLSKNHTRFGTNEPKIYMTFSVSMDTEFLEVNFRIQHPRARKKIV